MQSNQGSWVEIIDLRANQKKNKKFKLAWPGFSGSVDWNPIYVFQELLFLWFATRFGLGGSSSIIFFVHGSVIRQYWKWTKFLNFIALSNKPWTSGYSFSVDFIYFNYKNEMDFNFLAATIVFFFIRSWKARSTRPYSPAAKRPIIVDLLTPGFPCFENPYPMDIHSQPSPLVFAWPMARRLYSDPPLGRRQRAHEVR
jgi:hypothetical protein